MELFTSTLISIAEESIPKSSTSSKRAKKLWFTDDCKEAIKQRRAALRRFNDRPTTENLNNYRIFRAKARRTIKESKRTSWRNYVSTLSSRTSIKKVWDAVRKINGRGKRSSLQQLKANGTEYQYKKDIADIFAETFLKNSSSYHYSATFRKVKHQKVKQPLKFHSTILKVILSPSLFQNFMMLYKRFIIHLLG